MKKVKNTFESLCILTNKRLSRVRDKERYIQRKLISSPLYARKRKHVGRLTDLGIIGRVKKLYSVSTLPIWHSLSLFMLFQLLTLGQHFFSFPTPSPSSLSQRAVMIHRLDPVGCWPPKNLNLESARRNSAAQSSSSRSHEFWTSSMVRSTELLMC